jgi:hypothetical protein
VGLSFNESNLTVENIRQEENGTEMVVGEFADEYYFLEKCVKATHPMEQIVLKIPPEEN